jgi:hypothetical protein
MRRVAGLLALVALVSASLVFVSASGAPGRYKKQGDSCVWDEKDSGPNQCQPAVEGRFKKDGDKCVWAAGDKGPDQCSPTGRWKKDGDRCVWAPGDAGPNQCNPKQAK